MKYLLLIFIFILACCSKKAEVILHKDLIFFKSAFLAEYGDDNYDKLLPKTKKKISAKYVEDIIYVTNFIETNACGKYIGNIEVKNDSIYLSHILDSDEICTSTALEKVTYIINNPSQKKYKFAMR